MEVHVVPAGELTPGHLAAWDRIQRSDPTLHSPYFRAEFTQAVAARRGGVEVAVLNESGRHVGFLPYQRGRWGRGRPVGFPLNDFQGWIVMGEAALDPLGLLQACRLKSLRFDHWLASQVSWQPFHCVTARSSYIDLSAGFAAYQAARSAGGSEELKHVLRKERKCQREVGAVRVEHDSRSAELFEALVAWKTQQCRSTGVASALDVSWIRSLLFDLWQREDPALRGQLSALYIGDRLAAVHLGVRSFDVLHWWFPAYDAQFGKYSPGTMLLVEMTRAAESIGLRRIDLGKGEQEFKRNLMTGATLVAEGSVDTLSWSRWMWRSWLTAKDRIRGSRWHGAAHRVNRLLSQTRVWLGASD
jgi:CelD/BcsL family acetyltransferase involved in cellulose biosynthesis